MAWLGTWAKRVKLTIDNTDITAALTNFPILIYLSTSSGRNNEDLSFVFDELAADANRLKIAVTESDGTTECYVEIEKWDDANEKAWLWAKVPSVASGADTDLYLYYDVLHADNGAHVGDPDSVSAELVWDADFVFVSHMRDDPNNASIRDSTTSDFDGSKTGANEPLLTASGMIGEAQHFDGFDDSIRMGAAPLVLYDDGTVEAWVRADTLGAQARFVAANYWVLAYDFPSFVNSDAGYALNDGAWRVAEAPAATMNTLTWYHLAAAWDSVAGTVKFYMNGALLDTNVAYDGTLGSHSQTIRIGSNSFDTARYVDGIIDEVRRSKIGRPIAWINATYESGRDDLLDWGAEETISVGVSNRLLRGHGI